jgi:exonuclease III
VLRTVEYVLNDTFNRETGTSAFLLTFGNDVETYMNLPSQLPPAEFTSKYVKLLDENLKLVRDISKTYQDELVRENQREKKHDVIQEASIQKMVILNVYVPQGQKSENNLTFMRYLYARLKQLTSEKRFVILLGDFNIFATNQDL